MQTIKINSLIIATVALAAFEHKIINPDQAPEDQVSRLQFSFDGRTEIVEIPTADAVPVIAEVAETLTQIGTSDLYINTALVQFLRVKPVNADKKRVQFFFAGLTRLIEVPNAEADAVAALFEANP